MQKTIVPNNDKNETTDPMEYPLTIEPLFWGTGEMLVWDIEQLLVVIDRESLFNELFTGDNKGSPVTRREFETAADEVCHMIADSSFGGPRGFYSFFPVLSEGTSVIVLDPSDFHSELMELSFSAAETVNGRSVADFFRPDGDLIAISTFTAGVDRVPELLSGAPDASISTDAIHFAFQRRIMEILEKKLSIEIQRALGIEGHCGRSCSFLPENKNFFGIYHRLFEFLGIEDRLGIVTDIAITHQNYPAAIRYFIHHPMAK